MSLFGIDYTRVIDALRYKNAREHDELRLKISALEHTIAALELRLARRTTLAVNELSGKVYGTSVVDAVQALIDASGKKLVTQVARPERAVLM